MVRRHDDRGYSLAATCLLSLTEMIDPESIEQEARRFVGATIVLDAFTELRQIREALTKS